MLLYDRLLFNIIVSYLVKIITFGNGGRNYVNPSRAAPGLVKVDNSPYAKTTHQKYALMYSSTTSFGFALFTSVIVVSSYNLDTRNVNSQWVSGTLCTQELERMMAFFCSVFGQTELGYLSNGDGFTFSTRARSKGLSII
jgi:hypothetical protein